MRIGFDLDGVFVDKPPFVPKKLLEFFYRKHNQKLSYRIPQKPEQLFRKLTHASFLRPPISKNISFLNNGRIKRDNRYYLITSRFSFLEQETNDILERYKLTKYFDKIYANYKDEQPHVFKNKMIKDLDVNVFIDDDLLLLEFLSKELPKVKFFWLNGSKKGPLEKNLWSITDLSDLPI